jgi:hypothetical protein
MRKPILLATLGAMLVLAIVLGGGTQHTRAFVAPGIQDFNLDMVHCLLPSYPPDILSPDPYAGPYQVCKPGEDKAVGPRPTGAALSTGIAIIEGNRLGYPYVYNGPGWVLQGMVDSGANTVENMSATPTDEDLVLLGTQSIVDIDDKTGLADAVGRDLRVESEAMTLEALTGDGLGGAQDTMEVTRPSPAAHAQPKDIFKNQIANGTKVGDVASLTDLFQNGVVDVTADASNCGGSPKSCDTPLDLTTAIPEDYLKQTLAWGAGTGCNGEDESYLTQAMPGPTAMTKYVRYRACIDTLFLGGQSRITLPVPAPLNLVTLSPNWSPAGTRVNLVLLAGAANSPTTLLQGIDSPQASISHTLAPYTDNPAAPGLYVRWVTELSSQDEGDGALSFVYTTNCKAIGGNFVDNDADCLPAGVDPDDNNPDIDGDGLLDGVEVAWGSCPDNTFAFTLATHGFNYDCQFLNGVGGAARTTAQARDTDQDSRTDLEEMVGPTQFLTNPRVADTDGDGVNDGGYKVDLYDTPSTGCQTSGNPDGKPDFPDENGDSTCDSGISTNKDTSADGSSHVRVGYKIVGRDILADGAGNDNCPSAANAGQKNTDFDNSLVFNPNRTGLGNGDIYGDDCDTDDDNDEIVDDAETTFKWDSVNSQCSNVPPLPGPATPLNPLIADSDGDTVLDGVECLLGTNPYDGTSKPAPATSGDADKDGLSSAFETYQRSQSFSDQRPPAPVGNEDVDGDTLIGDADWDSDSDGVSDPCEAIATGTSLLRPDTDGNGTPDIKEPNARSNTLEIGNGAGITDADTSVPSQGSALSCSLDGDNDGIPNVTDSDPGGDVTYDDNGNGDPCVPLGTDAADDGPSWDANCNGVLDGQEAICPLAVNPEGDDDGDGLLNTWEVCKWGTDPKIVDSDGDTLGDCTEAVDTDGNGTVDFGGDALNSARATLLSAAQFGKDGDFDLNGNNVLGGDFGADTLTVARMAFGIWVCQ